MANPQNPNQNQDPNRQKQDPSQTTPGSIKQRDQDEQNRQDKNRPMEDR